jgi:hypothetical protein
MAASSPVTPPASGYSIGTLEAAAVAFFGAFFSALGGAAAIGGVTGTGLEVAVIAGAGAAATALGYVGYQKS